MSLTEKKCKPCSGETEALTRLEAESMLKALKEWQLNLAATEISKTFSFKNFYHTMNFVNAVAFIANAENHHPDLLVGYNYCTVKFSTHSIKGLSENDFIAAAKVDALT